MMSRQIAKNHKGQVHYSTWNRAGLGWILENNGSALKITQNAGSTPEVDVLQEALGRVQVAMVASFPEVEATRVAVAAQNARSALDRWIHSLSGQRIWDAADADWLCEVSAHADLAGPSANLTDSAVLDWESLTQFYLATVSARWGWPGGREGVLLVPVQSLRKQLSFRADEIAPHHRNPNSASSRPESEPLAHLIRKIQTKLDRANALTWEKSVRSSKASLNLSSQQGSPKNAGVNWGKR